MSLREKFDKKNATLAKTKLESGYSWEELSKKEQKLFQKYYPNSNMNFQHAHVYQVQRVALVLSRRSAWCDRITVFARYIGP